MSAPLDHRFPSNYSVEELKALKIDADLRRAENIKHNHDFQVRLSDARKKHADERAAREAEELAVLMEQTGSLSEAEELFAQRRMPLTMSREESQAFCKAVNDDEAKFNESKGRSGVVWCGD